MLGLCCRLIEGILHFELESQILDPKSWILFL